MTVAVVASAGAIDRAQVRFSGAVLSTALFADSRIKS
jgi:hypothetical protein